VRVAPSEDIGESVGTYGWDGGLGAEWRTDPARERVAILMTNQAWSSPDGPDIVRTFRRLAFG
jgi:CubicO group peptidase (beta-lactamase class C family)